MRMRILVLGVVAACSNAADPATRDAPPPVGSDAPPPPVDMPGDDDAPPGVVHVLVVNEVAPGESPDWFEVVNATFEPVQMADFVFVDVAGDFAKAVAFPARMLGPGERFAQDVDGTVVPFKLASDEEIWVYRAADHALSDGIDWDDGVAPAGSSYARMPDTFGAFATTATQTKGAPNQ